VKWTHRIATAVVLLVIGLPAYAELGYGGRGGGGMGRDYRRGAPPFGRALFPPEMVMRHAQDIGLSDEQREQITSVIQQVQSDIVPLEWEVRERAETLADLLEQPRVDEAAALAQVERVTDIENQMKKTHLALLIRVKNALSEEQQQQLLALREERREERRDEFRGRRGTRGPPSR
jgi:Spy/CpxP family protein refolding chaperone